MTSKKIQALVIVVFMVLSVAACGSTEGVESSQSTSAISSAGTQDSLGQLAEEAAEMPQPDTMAESASSSAIASSADKLVGEWADTNDETRTVKIAGNGSEYQYTDQDGTYAGTYKDGVLTIKISDAENDTASVFIDSKSGNLVTNYQGDIYEFTRK